MFKKNISSFEFFKNSSNIKSEPIPNLHLLLWSRTIPQTVSIIDVGEGQSAVLEGKQARAGGHRTSSSLPLNNGMTKSRL